MATMLQRRSCLSGPPAAASQARSQRWHVSRPGQPRMAGLASWGYPLDVEKRAEIAACTSFFDYKGKHRLRHPDRSHYLLGSEINDGMLDLCDPGKNS